MLGLNTNPINATMCKFIALNEIELKNHKKGIKEKSQLLYAQIEMKSVSTQQGGMV